MLFGDDLGGQNGPLMSPTMYREYYKPYHKRLWTRAKELAPHIKVHLHCCGGVEHGANDLIISGAAAQVTGQRIVDLVVQIGAPKGVSRILQRIGRANHRLDQPSRALLVPGNRFEVLECRAALEGVRAASLDGDPPRPGGLEERSR